MAFDEQVMERLADKITYHNLVPTVLGAGCGTLSHKFHAVAHSCFLESGSSRQSFAKYCHEVLCTTTDLGTEIGLQRIMPVDCDVLFPWHTYGVRAEMDENHWDAEELGA